MIDIGRVREQVTSWRRSATRTGSMSWLDRWRVRRALFRRYRSAGLAPPCSAFVSSPLAAAIATGIATGVRWLQRHPETHSALFPHSLDRDALSEATRAAAAAAVGALGAGARTAAMTSDVCAAIGNVTSGAPRWLPAHARGSQRAVDQVDAAPALAAEEGWIADSVLAPLAKAREQIVMKLDPNDRHLRTISADSLGRALDTTLGEATVLSAPDSGPAGFLLRVLAAWWAKTQSFDRPLGELALAMHVRDDGRVALDHRAIHDLARLARRTSCVFVHADFWVAAERPRIQFDARGRIHRIGGPAVTWGDGVGLSFLHDVHVPTSVACGEFGVREILEQANAEVRRTMIELYERDDHGRFLRDACADVVHRDEDRLGNPRRLLRLELWGDEPYVGVEVVNSTPEPDGSHRRYILRVPPHITTCRAAIAWTFDLGENEYEPVAET